MRRAVAVVVAFSAVGWCLQGPPRGGEGAQAASPPPAVAELRVLGSNSYLPGSWSSLRVVSYDPATGRPVPAVPVEVHLQSTGHSTVLFSGTTNADGTIDGRFKVPGDMRGASVLRVTSPLLAGVELSAPVTVQDQDRLYLTTDKPLYQPGQSIHVRMLALKEPDLVPAGDTSCQIEITDPRGNVVFRQSRPTSKFGVAAAQFDLASEVNMGEYRVQAACGEFHSEKSFTVKRYVLPKFKVTVTTDKAWYEPGEKIYGHVQASYFFGKPVAHGRVALHLRTFDTSERDVEELEGVTDDNGNYSFDTTLPSYFTGRPLDRGAAPLDIVADVVDTTNHKEIGPLALSVVSNPISVDLFPESGNLVPDLSNRIYVLSSAPDGKAVSSHVTLTVGGQTLTTSTDATGFGTVEYTPKGTGALPVRASYGGRMPTYATTVPVTYTAVEKDGTQVKGSTQFTQDGGSEAVLLRVDKALYRVGDVLHANVFSTHDHGTVYVDVVRDGHTLVTRSVDLKDHRASMNLTLGPDLSGAVSLHAYQVGLDQNVVRDVRQIFVQPASDLQVNVSMDKTTYRPGEDARLTFVVKNAHGVPRLAVLGVDIVDESLFALAENQPGLEKVYFLLEKAMLDPKVEVHGFSLKDVVVNPKAESSVSEQNLSRVALSRVEHPSGFTLDLSSAQVRTTLLMTRLEKVQQALYTYNAHHVQRAQSLHDLLADKRVTPDDLTDPWGHPLFLRNSAQVVSAGPDGRPGTADDITLQTLERDTMPMRGGFGRFEEGAMRDRIEMVPAPPAAANGPVLAGAGGNVLYKSAVVRQAPESTVQAKKTEAAPARVREFFPETLYTNPQVLTDENGRATITVPLADSITTWRLGAFASSMHGELGNVETPVRVFQPFFVDLDLPVALTQHDEVSVPVAVYNYLPEPQTVTLRLQGDQWFTALDGTERTLHLTRNQVSVVYYRIRAVGTGTERLTVRAEGTKFSDAVRRPVDVEPDGKAFDSVVSDRLQGDVHKVFLVPKEAVQGASRLMLTIYPGVFAQVMEGMDAIFRMPNGCFEQTSSTTYPNVLVMDYLRKLHRLSPEIQMKADGYINTGYQRLLTFEVPGGGFSVFGQAPANPILTAYGVMEFADMARVHDIDPHLVERTRSWLLAQQQKDGSWSAGREGFYAEGWSHIPNDNLVATSYITWALLNTGDRGPGVQRAVAYVKAHLGDVTDPYSAALVANTLVAAHDGLADKALAVLASMATEDKDALYWQTRISTAAFGTGTAGDVETTALAALAMEGNDHYANQVNKALTWLTRCKDRNGTWQSTQATVLALKAMIGSIDEAREKANARIDVVVNGKPLSTVTVTPETSDVFRQIDLTSLIHLGENDVTLHEDGKGNCQYRLVGTVYRPWSEVGPDAKTTDPLGLDVSYDRTHLETDNVAECTVKVSNRVNRIANQVVVDVGVPPGFDVQDDDLAALVSKHVIARFANTGRQIIIYFEKLDPSSTTTLTYRVKARYPLRAQVPESRVYEYYDPSRHADVRPTQMVVTGLHP